MLGSGHISACSPNRNLLSLPSGYALWILRDASFVFERNLWSPGLLLWQSVIPVAISRVNQFDAARLDVEMSAMLKEQLVKVFTLMKVQYSHSSRIFHYIALFNYSICWALARNALSIRTRIGRLP